MADDAPVAPVPVPDEELIWRVTGLRDADLFVRSGRQSVADIEAVLAGRGLRLTDFPRVLDFGCGCGRILQWLKDVAGEIELHGADIDADAICWVNSNVPWARAEVSPHRPPMAYPDGYFDLVFNHSVFTHLDEAYQDAWLEELRRITRPGGYVLLTVSGEHPFAGLLESWRAAGADPSGLIAEYRSKGILYISEDSWTGGPFPDFYHSTFHRPGYVFEHWSTFFDLKTYTVRGSLDFQDFILLQRPLE